MKPEQNLNNVKNKLKEAGSVVRDYAYSQKEDHVNRMKNELKNLKKDLADLEEKAISASTTAKEEVRKNIQAAKDSVNKLNGYIESIINSDGSKWEEARTKINESIDGVKSVVEKSREWLSKKIAP